MVFGCVPSDGRSSVPLVGPAAFIRRSNSRRGNDVRALASRQIRRIWSSSMGLKPVAATMAPYSCSMNSSCLLVVDRPGGADLRAHAALAVFEHVAVVGIDGRDLRHGLRKRDIDRAAVVHAEVKLVRNLLLRTLFRAQRRSRCRRSSFTKRALLRDFHV